MNPLSKIQKLLDQKRKVEKEIETIQTSCSHKVKHIKFVFLNPHSQQTAGYYATGSHSNCAGQSRPEGGKDGEGVM